MAPSPAANRPAAASANVRTTGPPTPNSALPSDGSPSPSALSSVHYVVPPGWDLTTSTPVEARLADESGLTITLTAAPGTVPPAAVAAGKPVVVDGSAGLEISNASGNPPGYDVRVGVVRSGMAYVLICHGPDPADPQTVRDVCDGFIQGLRWMTSP